MLCPQLSNYLIMFITKVLKCSAKPLFRYVLLQNHLPSHFWVASFCLWPTGHLHSYEPTELMQFPPWQTPGIAWHSSTSANTKKDPDLITWQKIHKFLSVVSCCISESSTSTSNFVGGFFFFGWFCIVVAVFVGFFFFSSQLYFDFT